MAMIQAKLGPISFGSLTGFVLQVMLFRPTTALLAAERAIAAVVAPLIFARPLAKLLSNLVQLDGDTMLTLSSGIIALGGLELIRTVRQRILKTADSGDNAQLPAADDQANGGANGQ